MEYKKSIEELQEHYTSIHEDIEVPWAIYDHTYLQHLPYLLDHVGRHKE